MQTLYRASTAAAVQAAFHACGVPQAVWPYVAQSSGVSRAMGMTRSVFEG